MYTTKTPTNKKCKKKKSSCIKTVKYRSINDYIFFFPNSRKVQHNFVKVSLIK